VWAGVELEAARVRLQDAANRRDLTLAVPNPTPSSPKGLVILGLAFVSTLVSGLDLAVWLDRFHAQEKVFACTGVPCLGMVPRLSDPTAATLSLDTVTALRAVAVGAGLIGAAGLKKVAMITSALPREGTSAFAAGLAKVLVSEGQRVLLVDALSQLQLEDGALSLEEVLADGQELWAAHYGAPSYAPAILADRNVRVHCLGVEANAKPTAAPHHPALTGQSQRGAPQKPVQASFHVTTNECCEGKTSAGRYKALCSSHLQG
jgi:hypothetical protein